MKGTISQWKDDKGFGFITSDDNQKVFFHISSLTTKSRRPEIGDIVVFTEKMDNQNRLKATSVAIEGLSKTNHYKSNTDVEPKTKNFFDYLLILVLVSSIVFTAYIYFKSNNIEGSIIFVIPAVIALILLNRQKKPKSSSFRCTRCKKIELYDSRTISAWNRGFTRLYCNSCHLQWLRSRPRHEQEKVYSSNKSGGCLGTFTLILTTSFLGGYSVVHWLVQTVI
ncbi:cold shock domain-containing protein [Aliiglaciecola sp. 3_MG-2023]|uniref:cold shock domain-containing protein n=1 Tax=Aliiglaciecola sp. 3_MG-2023 TaxID=3062644 RepID=UPI0026E31ABC|nr:cold shock domain-containing protein [Aliiglaciecola sp. 3_MG-2023]MDO6693394.1 cold shock domain-containing protein [Aliiglaciecola sp. 3_MG-2023]